MLEHLGAELPRDPSYLVKRPANSSLRLLDLVATFGRTTGARVEVQEHASQQLADLVVQVARDSKPFRLLRCQHTPAAPLALALQPVEHLIEGPHHAADLIIAADLQPLAGAEQVDPVHPPNQPFQRPTRTPQP